MRKFFAMEEIEENIEDNMIDEVVEEAVVGDIAGDVEADVVDIEADANAIETAEAEAEYLEVQEEVLEEAAGEEGEGIDEIAAESIRLAMEASMRRLGAPKDTLSAVFAKENFVSKSSRKANAQFAKESLSEFLKDLWNRIKAAVKNLWNKIKAFWDKHVSNLGQVKKALESMKSKVAKSSGKFKDQAYLEKGDASLARLFPGKGDLTISRVEDVIAVHAGLAKMVEAETTKNMKTLVVIIQHIKAGEIIKVPETAGSIDDVTGLISGKKVTFEVNYDEETGSLKLGIQVQDDLEVDTEAGVMLADKSQLAGVLNKTIAVIDTQIAAKKNIDKQAKDFDNLDKEVSAVINAGVKDGDTAAKATYQRKALKLIRDLQNANGKLRTKFVGLDVRMAKGVLAYAGASLKRFEKK